MKKLIYILSVLCTSTAFSQVLISRDNSNTTVHSSVGLEARSDRQAAAFPQYNITSFTTYPYTKAPKEGSIVFSPNKNGGLNEDYYGYFFWDGSKWVKLLDAQSFVSDANYGTPYFYTNFDKATQTSVGIDVLSSFTGTTNGTASGNYGNTLNASISSKHVIGAAIDPNYWTIFDSGFQPTFQFAKQATGLIKVNANMVKPGAGTFDFSVAMAVFVNDQLAATKVYQMTSLTSASCFRKKATLLAPIGIINANQNYTIKLGFRIIGNNHFYYDQTINSNDNYTLSKGKIVVGKAFANTTTGTSQTGCAMTAFESPVNITVYGVTN